MATVFVRADLPATSPFDVGSPAAVRKSPKSGWRSFGSMRGGSGAVGGGGSSSSVGAGNPSAPATGGGAASVGTGGATAAASDSGAGSDTGSNADSTEDDDGLISPVTAERATAAKIWLENYFESLLRGTCTRWPRDREDTGSRGAEDTRFMRLLGHEVTRP